MPAAFLRPIAVEASSFPFIAHIVSAFPRSGGGYRRTVGTGTLIGPRVILTAGHNIFDPRKTSRGFASKWTVTLGGQKNGLVFDTTVSDTTRQWIETDSRSPLRARSAFDFGVLVIPRPVDSGIAPMGVETMSGEVLRTRLLNVAGFPSREFPAVRLFGTKSVPSQVTVSHILYPIATLPGMSGGPVYDSIDTTTNDRVRTIRGIHTAFFDRPGVVNDRGGGVRISSGALSLIRSWLDRFAPT